MSMIKRLGVVLGLALFAMTAAQADEHGTEAAAEPSKLLITVTSDHNHTQGMAMILATQAVKRGQEVRVLLCGDGTKLAVGRYRGATLEPAGANPQQMMKTLIEEHEVTVQVCGVFLPNTRHTEENLVEGVGVATPDEIGEYMADPRVRFFSH